MLLIRKGVAIEENLDRKGSDSESLISLMNLLSCPEVRAIQRICLFFVTKLYL